MIAAAEYLFLDEESGEFAVWTMAKAASDGTPTGDAGDMLYIGPVIYRHGDVIVARDESVPGRLYVANDRVGSIQQLQVESVLKVSKMKGKKK